MIELAFVNNIFIEAVLIFRKKYKKLRTQAWSYMKEKILI
jgi:hypothetical protein